MRHSTKLVLAPSSFALVASAMLVTAPRALAQEGDEFRLDRVTVTARRQDESLQDVPVAVTAVSSRTIEDRTLSELSQVQEIAPNVLFGESVGVQGSSRVYIRGIGENLFIFTAEQAVGIYVDGIPLTRPLGSNVSLLDAERVEVLRGPQGTTFGRNTVGGAINFVTRRPSDEFEGYVQARIGNFNRLNLRAATDIPVSDALKFRLSAGSTQRDGFIENDFPGEHDLDDEDNWQVRAIADWTPTSRLNILASVDVFEARESTTGTQLLFADLDNPFFAGLIDSAVMAQFGISVADSLDGDPWRGSYSFGNPIVPGFPPQSDFLTFTEGDVEAGRNNADVFGAYIIAEYQLNEFLTAKSLTSYRDSETANWNDSFGTIWPVSAAYTVEASIEQSQEFQLLGNGLLDGRLDFVSGIFLGNTVNKQAGDNFFLMEALDTFNFSSSRLGRQETDSIAAFSNVNFDLTDRWGITVGARWTEDTKDFIRAENPTFPPGTDLGPFGIAGPGATPTVVFERDNSWSAWSGNISAQYDWTDDIMTYFGWSRGFRSGGFSGFGRSEAIIGDGYEPEFASVFEAGLRSSWLDGRFVFNATAFHTDYTDQQLNSFFFIPGDTPDDPPQTGFRIQNAGESEIQGIEIEAEYAPIENWVATFAYGLTDAEFTQLDSPLQAGSTVEQDLQITPPHVPEHTANASLTYTAPVFGGDLRITGDVNYRSKIYFDLANSERIAQDGYALFGSRVSWTTPDDGFEVAAWGRNLGDEEYKVMGFDVVGLAGAFFGEPRTYGIEVTKRW